MNGLLGLFSFLTEPDGAQDAKGDWQTYIILGVIVVLFIAFFIWSSYSNKKKQKQAQDMVDSIKIGDKVKTIGGICGYVSEINNEENTFVLETGAEGNSSFVKFDKGAIYQTTPANASVSEPSNSSTVDGKKID